MRDFLAVRRQIRRVGFVAAFTWLFVAGLEAQTLPPRNVSDGTLPLSIYPGAPAGSYPLSGFEQINVYNGHLNASVPLLKVGGRGPVQSSVVAAVSRPTWTVDVQTVSCGTGESCWTSSTTVRTPSEWWNPYQVGYGPGMMLWKRSGNGYQACQVTPIFNSTFSYLVFQGPDGTEHAFYDTAGVNGAGKGVIGQSCQGVDDFRGGTLNPPVAYPFVALDGSGMTFVPDVNSPNFALLRDAFDIATFSESNYLVTGKLMMKDGTQYDIVNGLVQNIRDRNGNRIEYEYATVTIGGQATATPYVKKIIDPLKREILIDYDVDPSVPGTQVDRIKYTGGDGGVAGERVILVKKTAVANRLRSGYSADTVLFSELASGPLANFPSLNKYISEIVLPNGKKYEFFYNPYGEVARAVVPTGGAIEYEHGAGVDSATGSGVYASGQILDSPDGIQRFQSTPPEPLWRPVIYRRLRERREYPDGGGGAGAEAGKTVYTPAEERTGSGQAHPGPPAGRIQQVTLTNRLYVKTTTTGTEVTTPIVEHQYFFSKPFVLSPGDPASSNPADGGPANSLLRTVLPTYFVSYPDGYEGKQYISETLGLRRTEHRWGGAGKGIEICQRNVTLLDATPNKASATVFRHDRVFDDSLLSDASNRFGNLTDVYEYDFGNAPALGPACPAAVPSNFTRRKRSDYKLDPNYTSQTVHLRALPEQERIFDGAATLASRTDYIYDTATPLARPNISNLTAVGNERGNVTQLTRYLTGSSSVSTQTTYDVAGNPIQTTDGRGNTIQFSYDDSFTTSTTLSGLTSYAFVTNTTYPAPFSGRLPREVRTKYNYYLGAVTEQTQVSLDVGAEPSPTVTKVFYAENGDVLDRPSRAIRGWNNSSLQSETKFTYNDNPSQISVTTRRDQYQQANPSEQGLADRISFDGFGRRVKTISGVSDAISADTVYDGAGRVRKQCNPYRSGDTGACTTTSYDALSRAIAVTNPDGSSISIGYVGNTTTVTDEAGRARILTNDGLGRLTSVTEGGVTTSYQYNLIDRLRYVIQPGVIDREFTYDLAGRMLTANNPETGLISHTYDGNDNPVTRTQGGNVVVTHTYDALNRLTKRTTSGESGANYTTPDAHFCYDGQTYSTPGGPCTGTDTAGKVGRLTATGSTVSSTTYGYDGLGRVIQSSQRPAGASGPYNFTYSYYFDGSLATQTYPSGLMATTCYDNNGRIGWVSKNHSSTDCRNGTVPASGFYAKVQAGDYAAHGAAKELGLGNGLWEHRVYNTRLQTTEIGLGGSRTTTEHWKILLEYSRSGENNNGNVLKQAIVAPGLNVSQYYRYDAVNRLELATENPPNPTASPALWDCSGSATGRWCEQYGYSGGGYGNRGIAARLGISPDLRGEPAVFTVQNRITGGAWGYDARGNVKKNLLAPVAETFLYDSENRLVRFCTSSADAAGECTAASGTGRTLYSYDAEGRRVKQELASGQTIEYVYDAFGQLAAEYGGTVTVSGTQYLTADHLGTTRVVSDAGQVRKCQDYMPFGAEIGVGGGSLRAASPCYGHDLGVRQKFTGKERDAESGLDYFGARYFSGAQGRFTGPDPFNPILEFGQQDNGEDEQEESRQAFNDYIGNPQHWNRYAYALNNPLAFKDEDGRVPVPVIIAAVGAAAASPAGQRAMIAGSVYLQRYAPQLQRIALTSGQAISKEVFTLGPALRGRAVEALSGAPRAFANFPALDKPLTPQGIATSIKSVDVFAKTYQSGNALFSRLAGYVDQLASARGGQVGQAIIRPEQIKGRVLEIIVPKDGIQAAQQTFQRVIQYAKKYKDLEVVFKETQ